METAEDIQLIINKNIISNIDFLINFNPLYYI